MLISLQGGTFRFSAWRRKFGGVSQRMQAQSLQWLEEDGLVRCVTYEVVPPHVECSLTPLRAEAPERVRSLGDWIEPSTPTFSQV
ncbi:helix-turn-helix domain-containing protein [Puniceibacterium sp. IMCC21224]|uniref:winged helix-turn-helix transcriptional regulator n=1 Tax=Puniceibacterium sp. IMCC21224 TaxID=1618204 RepID=UPI00065D2B8B|nr:helix-turn-helix domain-containing protein [Puniceibacterium sp. IMCC21224]KMK67464.1 transcriptional regulator, HxlR family [Puniceibacterium sp. IMCC21224]